MSTPPGIPVVKEKKGMSCLAIGGIGCLVIVVVLFLGGGAIVAKFAPGFMEKIQEYQKEAASNPDKAAAKLGIKLIPGVVIVKEDDAAKSITFKTGEAGEELTMHYEGMNSGKGKPRVTNSKGEEVGTPAAAEAAPVPAPPAAPAPAPNN
jgi:hypothetical protein